METGFIPDDQFVPDQTDQIKSAQAAPSTSPDAGFIPDDQFTPDEGGKHGTLEQQTLAGIEGFGRGLAGPLAPLAERAAGINPEDIRARSEENPWTHGIAEAAGFGAGLFTGTSEAKLLGAAGEGAVKLAGLGGEAANFGSRLAAGAVRMATEMGLYQAGDEASKAILQDPEAGVGNALSHVALSTVLGGAAGIPLTALGIGAKSVMKSQVLKDFADRLSFRGANLDPHEMMQHELSAGINSFEQIGDELNGFSGLKAQAIAKLLPESITPEISAQIQSVSDKALEAVSKMKKGDVPARLSRDFQEASNRYLETVTNPEATVSNQFDALNQFKNDIQDYSKGRYGINAPQRTAEDYQFLKITKELGHDIKNGLEHTGTWGEAADVQKSINKAWSESIPAVKDATKKFMSRVGNEYVVDPQKFVTYMNQSGRATSPTIRQQMMGNFVDSMESFHKAVADVAEKAGIENPITPISLNALRESVSKPSVGSKLADLWYSKLGPTGSGDALGGGAGFALGHATGIPEAGIAGAYLGKWVLGPIFSSVIKPIMEKGANSRSFQSAIAYSKAALSGQHALTNAASDVFGAGLKTAPSHAMRSDIEDFDENLKKIGDDPQKLIDVAGNLGDYLPEHAQALSQHAMTAVNYLNGLRPSNPKLSPLDSDIPVSKNQSAPFHRALEIADQPLRVFEHVKNGSLLPQDVTTLRTINPAYYNRMAQELTNAMAVHVADGRSVPYKTRQSMSLFLGQGMDSTMSPQSMQSIQAVFAKNKAAAPVEQQPVGGKKGSPSKLGKSAQNLRTPEQARADRAND